MANQALIQGAYNIARAEAASSAAELEGKLGITSSIQKGVTDFIEETQKEGKKYDDYAQKVIDEAGMLSQEETANLYNELQAGRNKFIFGNKKDKTLSMRELGFQAVDYKDYEDARLKLAKLKKDNTNGLSASWLEDPNNKSILDIMDDSPRLVKKKCKKEGDCPDKGRLGVEINGEWTSISSINSKIEEGLIDVNFRKDINILADKFSEDSSKIVDGQDDTFPIGEAKQKVNSLLNSATNIQSVARDNMFGETSFYEDRFLKLVDPNDGETYSSLGITQDMIGDTGVNVKDGIDEDEAKLLMDSLMQNEDLLKQELSEYYIMYMNQNWNNAARKKPKEGYYDVYNRFKEIPQDINEYNDPNYTPETIEELIETIKVNPNFTEEQKKERIDYLKDIIPNVE